MIRQKVNLLQSWLSIACFLVPGAAFGLAGYVRFQSGYFSRVIIDPYAYTTLLVAVTVAWGIVSEHYQLNRITTLTAPVSSVRAVSKATVSTMALVLAVSFFYRDASFSRVFVVSGGLLMFFIALAMFQIFRAVIVARVPHSNRFRIAILGADELAFQVAEKLRGNAFLGCDVICFVALPGQKPSVASERVLDWAQLEEVVDTLHCQEILIALPPGGFGQLQGLWARVQALCVPARVVLDFGEGVFVPDRIFDFYGVPLLDVRPYPVDTVAYAVAKRIFDLAFSAVVLVVLAPLFALIALAIKLTSPGPVFFEQERVSLNGKRFQMLKFRSMIAQSDDSSSTHHTARGDPRITRVGSFLRKTSLDEFPQFLNVLRGDMSVVGPRPELTFFVQKFRGEVPSYMARHNVKCGITGWAQINGLRGSDTSIPRRIEHDLHYMRHWSLWLDIKIIFLTLFRGVWGKAAY